MDIHTTLAERGKVHGLFEVNASCAQRLKATARGHNGWDIMNSVQRESMEMILHKIARILAGDPNHADHWYDIAGYAILVVNAIEGQPNAPTSPDR